MASHRIPFESLSAAERSRLVADNDRLRQQLRDRHRMADLAGNSRAIRRVCELIAQVAPSSHSVCLQGEDGVGKTRAARAIHTASRRSAGPWVSVNCSSMLDEDVDAQLSGCVARAKGGTLFLDDIADLGPIAQDRVLASARECVPLDFRVIASSNRDLKQEAAAGRCRLDLWEHFGALTIQMPPLRERK